MRIGKLRTRVTIQGVTRTPDGGGGFTEGWGDVATVWASVDPRGGSERLIGQELQSITQHTVQMRYRADVKPAMRLLVGTRVLEILSTFNVDERGRELVLICEEVRP